MRSFRKGMRRRMKAPVQWERFSQLFTTAGTTVLQTAIASSAFFEAAGTTERDWTLKRIRMSWLIRYSAAIRVPNCTAFCGFGLQANSGVAGGISPFTPGNDDWMDIWNVEAQLPPGDLATIPNGSQFWYTRDVRVSRRISTNEFLFLVMAPGTIGGVNDTTPVWSAFGSFSLLWSGTPSPRR